VLKDASAAAIYGSRSAGGVILITTKRGQASRTMVSYNAYLATSTMANKPNMLTADEWKAYAKETGKDTGSFDKYGANTDWFDEISRKGVSQSQNISMSGGGSKNNYRASFSYLKNQGVIRDDALERYGFRFQFQQRAINDRLRLSLTSSGTMISRDIPYTRNFVLAYNMLPVYPVKLSDGSWFDTVEYDQGNPVRNQTYNQNNSQVSLFNGNGELLFNIMKGLDIKLSLYKERNMRDNSQFHSSSTEAGRDDGGWAQRENQRWDKSLMEWLLDYKKSLGTDESHKINAMLGYSWEGNGWSYARVANRSFVTDMLGSNSLQSGQGLRPSDVETHRNMNRLISFFGRANYSYKDRYMLTATLRRDGSTKFGENHKWGLFPSASAAWGISQESFLENSKWIDELKLRVGYGVTGNQAGLDPYKTLELYGTNPDGTSNIYYDDGAWKTAYQITQNPNPNLKWESTAMFNIGLDFTLLKGKVSGVIEWYNKLTSDMLYTYSVPSPPYMYTSMMANVGDMKNTGIELALTWNVLRSKDFSWTTTATADHNKNEITRLSNDLYTTSRVYVGDAWIRGGSGNTTHVIEEGYPVGQFYGWKFLEFDDNGHYIMEDVTKDGQISDDDRTYIGTAWPVMSYGWNNAFTFKNWDFSFFFRGMFGNKVLNHARMAYAQPNYLIGANALNDPLIYQLKEVPKYCSLYIEDGSFLRLDNISLGYTFNTKKLNWLSNARVYVTGQNIFVISKFKGPDPEVDMSRNNSLAPGVLDRQFYPKAHTYSVGVSLTF
jgi:iron complex outermembrane receptor protein